MDSLACAGAGSCVAVGGYSPNPPGLEQGFIATESKGKWGPAVRPRLPLNASAATDAGLFGVTCTGRRSCVAVGLYANSSGQIEGMAVAESKGRRGRAIEAGGRWRRARRISPPASAGVGNPDQGSFAEEVTCAGGPSCVAVGFCLITSSNREAMATTVV